MLERSGYQVDVAENGEEALESFTRERGRYDAILMDCQMPVMDGYEATRAIRQIEQSGSERIPIIALTAHAMPGDAEKCFVAGMDAYLTKPLDFEKLHETLAERIGGEGEAQ